MNNTCTCRTSTFSICVLKTYLELETKITSFLPHSRGKNFKYNVSTLMNDTDQKPFKKYIPSYSSSIKLYVQFFLSNSKKKLRFHFWSSHIPHLREFVQISVTNEISKNSNFTNSNAKSIRLRSKPFSIPRKHFIKKPWGNFHFSRFSIYHLISHMKTSVVRLSKNHRK